MQILQLVDELVAELRRTARHRSLMAFHQLDSSLNRSAGLRSPELDTLAKAMADARPALESVLARLRNGDDGSALSDRTCRDLTSFARRFCVTVDHLTHHREAGLHERCLAVQYSCIDLVAMVKEQFAAFGDLARARDIGYWLDAPERLECQLDVEKVQLVILNLLFNAFKYTPRGGELSCVVADDGDDAVLRICDSGPGIGRAQAEDIFERSRLIDRNAFLSVGGIGIQLSTSRDFLGLLGGSLTLDRWVQRGACFEARIPRTAPADIPATEAREPDPDLGAQIAAVAADELAQEGAESYVALQPDRPSVLIAVQSPSVHRIIRRSLESRYSVAGVFDGEAELARILDESEPDLVVIDADLKGLPLEVAVSLIRSREALCDTPILVLIEEDDPAELLRVFQLGVQDALHRPFVLAELRARLDNLIAFKVARDVLNRSLGQHRSDLVRLATEIATKQHEVEAAREVAEKANRMKSNFLRIISHELKTPIAAMQLHVHLLRRDPNLEESPALKGGVDALSRTSKRLVQLIDSAMAWARFESGRLKLAIGPLHPADILSEVADECSSAARLRGVELDIEASGPVSQIESDRHLLRLILLNMISRAIMVTDSGSVRVVAKPDGTDRLHLEVHDGSPPVPAEEREQILNPLEAPGFPHASRGPGSGLELHVAQTLADVLGGELTLGTADGDHNMVTLEIGTCLEASSTAVHPESQPRIETGG